MKGAMFCPRCCCDTIPNPGGWCCWCDTRLFTPVRMCACGAQVTQGTLECHACRKERRHPGHVDGRVRARPDGLCSDCESRPRRDGSVRCSRCNGRRYRTKTAATSRPSDAPATAMVTA